MYSSFRDYSPHSKTLLDRLLEGASEDNKASVNVGKGPNRRNGHMTNELTERVRLSEGFLSSETGINGHIIRAACL